MNNETEKRMLLKISGEALAKGSDGTFNFEILREFAETVKKCRALGWQVAIVSGAGNIWRGRQGYKMDASRADQMGMTATVVNSLAICDFLEQAGVPAEVMCAFAVGGFVKCYNKFDAERALDSGKVVVISGGTGNPYFSTDTAAVLRAAELDVDMVLFAKNVSYIYNRDPNAESDEPLYKYKYLSFGDILEKKLTAIDITATAFCLANDMTIHVFGINDMENIVKTVCGEETGTVVYGKETVILDN